MIRHDAFSTEPWQVRETSLELDLLAQSESLFALSNGHLGLRGNLDEGDPHGIPGTYLGGFYESHPLPYAERGYGYPEAGQTVVDVTNGKLVRLLVGDEPLDVRFGRLLAHERVLDLRAGTLFRELEWESPVGVRVRIRSTRLVSFTRRAVAAIAYEVELVDNSSRLTLQSELVANETQPERSKDPRTASALRRPLVAVSGHLQGDSAVLLHRTRMSGLLLAAGMDHRLSAPWPTVVTTQGDQDWARTTVVGDGAPGQVLRLEKFLAYGWSSVRPELAVRDQVSAALADASASGWACLLAEQRAYLDAFWDSADVEVDGDPTVQQAVRFGLFHVLQAGARCEGRAIASKGLTGPGYDGHAFWDTEGFVLPVLTWTVPETAADALRWRHSTLELAADRARTLDLQGVALPWRTIRGEECSAYWPGGTAGFHLNADVAYALERHRIVTGSDALEAEIGLELLVGTARLWLSVGHQDDHGAWHIDGVTGPDEYSAVADDNIFTNLMAARNLLAAAEACLRHPEQASRLAVSSPETAAWRAAADSVHLPFDEQRGVHAQSAGFTGHAEWDFESWRHRYPLLLHAPYVQLYRKQVVKQADLVLAMHWCPEHFTPEQKARNVDYYERRTVRDSSLSACTQAVMCAEVGHLDLAHDYLTEAATIDLHDLHKNTRDGLHMASLAGTWIALVEGFGGLRLGAEQLCLDPQLPDDLDRLAFRLRWRGQRLLVEVTPGQVRLSLPDPGSVAVVVAGRAVQVSAQAPMTVPWRRRVALLPVPPQPAGREVVPERRS